MCVSCFVHATCAGCGSIRRTCSLMPAHSRPCAASPTGLPFALTTVWGLGICLPLYIYLDRRAILQAFLQTAARHAGPEPLDMPPYLGRGLQLLAANQLLNLVAQLVLNGRGLGLGEAGDGKEGDKAEGQPASALATLALRLHTWLERHLPGAASQKMEAYLLTAVRTVTDVRVVAWCLCGPFVIFMTGR